MIDCRLRAFNWSAMLSCELAPRPELPRLALFVRETLDRAMRWRESVLVVLAEWLVVPVVALAPDVPLVELGDAAVWLLPAVELPCCELPVPAANTGAVSNTSPHAEAKSPAFSILLQLPSSVDAAGSVRRSVRR